MEHRAIAGRGRDGMSAAPAPSLIERELAAVALAFARRLIERGFRIVEAERFARGETP